MKKITRKRLKEALHYDQETGVFTHLISTRRKKTGDTAGFLNGGINRNGMRGSQYRAICVDSRTYNSSHLAVFYMTGRWPKHQVDHRNLDSLDNRWDNLRPATQSQNGANKRCYRSNGLGLKGVWIHRYQTEAGPKLRFRAMIQVQKKRVCAGYYSTPEEAHAAYVIVARKFYGEFARAG